MAARRRKLGPGKPARNDKAVKIDRTLADKASFVSDRRGTTLAEFLTDLLRGPIDREFAKEMKRLEGGDRP